MRAYLFDLGDTLLQEERFDWADGYRAIQSYLKPEVTSDQLKADVKKAQQGLGEFDCLAWVGKNKNEDAPTTEWLEWAMWKQTVTLTLIEGVREMLNALKTKGVPLGIISNAPFSALCLKKELEKHELSGFEFVLSSADFGIRKPAAEMFLHAAERLKLNPEDIGFVGDRWEADVVGAKEVGMVPMLRVTPKAPESVDCFAFETWAEFQATIDT